MLLRLRKNIGRVSQRKKKEKVKEKKSYTFFLLASEHGK